jgi:hypothetical protein
MYYRKFARSLNHDNLWILVDYDSANSNSVFKASILESNDKFFPGNWKKKHISNRILLGTKSIISESSNL